MENTKLENLLEENLKEALVFMDKLIEKIQANGVNIEKTLGKLMESDAKGEKNIEAFTEYMKTIAENSIIDMDVKTTLVRLNTIYGMIKLSGMEIELEDNDTKRLDELRNNASNNYIVFKDTLVEKNPSMMQQMRDKMGTRSEGRYDSFMQQLKANPNYVQKNTNEPKEGKSTSKGVDKPVQEEL